MRYLTTLCAIALLLLACGKQQSRYTLEGSTGKGNDTLYIYGVDDRHPRIDTIVTDRDGEFSYTLPIDTTVPLNVVMHDGAILPLYAEPNIDATLSLDNNRWQVKGGALQTLHDSIVSKLDSIGELTQRYEAIDSFIVQHPYSDVNIFLLWHYFVESDEARSSVIRHRIEMMGGTLQDNSYIASIKKAVSAKQQNIQHRSAPNFKLKTLDGKTLHRADYKDKYLLLTFWASWDSASVKHIRKLKELTAEADTATFQMLNVSLDYDTEACKQMIKNDTLPGSHVCDATMWENSIVKEFTINRLPFSVLINPYMRVDKFNVTPEWIISNVDSLTTGYKDKNKRQAASKRAVKIKSSSKAIQKTEPQKKREKSNTKPRLRPGIKKVDNNQQAQSAEQEL